MALQLAQPVVYQVPAEHQFIYAEAQIAGMVTRINADGTAELILFPTEKAPVHVSNVWEGAGLGMAQIPAPSA